MYPFTLYYIRIHNSVGKRYRNNNIYIISLFNVKVLPQQINLPPPINQNIVNNIINNKV